MTIEDQIPNEELDACQASWHHQQQLEKRRIFETIISHHELDKIRGTNTAMAYAGSNGLKSEFEQYLTETEKELK